MKYFYFCRYVLITFILLSSSYGLAYVSDSDITVLVGEDYLPAACELIRDSQESIFLKMYLFAQDSFGEVLARGLVEAHKRGVEVEVILDKSGEGDYKNEMAYTYLKEAGIKIRYDSSDVLTHSKLLVVDREIAIVGSQNWNRGSLSLNNEAGVLIRSGKISEGLLKGEVACDDNVITLTEDNYYTSLSKAFQEARESIHILIYSLERGPETRSLVDVLAKAKERGVEIEIMLDQSFRDNLPEGKNITGINLLREHGLANKFDSVSRLTHAKLIVIDGKKTFLGSQNWLDITESQYDEDSLLIVSEKVSRTFLQFIASLETSPSIFSEDEIGEGVRVPYSFLINETLPTPAVRLLDRSASRAFKLYLMLLHAKSPESSELNISNRYEELARPLGYDRSKIRDRGKYYRNYYKQHISRFLRILEHVHLVKFDHRSGLVIFLDPGGSEDLYVLPNDKYFVIQDNFWTYGWDCMLSHKAIYLYFIGLLERSLYPEEAWWSRSYKGMAELYEISPNTIWEALWELQRYNLIDVYRDAWEPDEAFTERERNRYHINRLYSMEDFESGWLDLKERYGEKLAKDARALAEELDEPYDLVIIESFIGLIQDYGLAKVKEANKKTASFRRSYGKRHFGYTKAILSDS